MPFRGDIIPLKFDKFHFLPYDRWLKEEWNNRIASCNRIDLPYCQKVALTDPLDRIQFKANYVGANILPVAPGFTGVSGTYLANHVNSTGVGTASEVGYLVHNGGSGATSRVVTVVSANQIELSADIFPTPGQDVFVYQFFGNPAAGWSVVHDSGLTLFCKASFAGLSTLVPDATIENLKWYYLRVEIRNYVSGEITVLMGGNVAGVIDTNGIHEFYQQSQGAFLEFQSTSLQDFVGCLVLESFELYELNTSDLTVVFSPNQTDILAYGPPTPVTGALLAGVVMDDAAATWGDITGGECACFYVTMFSDPCYTENYMQSIKSECWELDGANVLIIGTAIVFANAEEGESATYTCGMTCPIQCGEAYQLYFEVYNYESGSVEIRFANGLYSVSADGNYQFERTPSGLCSGLDVFTITATGPGVTSMEITNIQIRKLPVFADANLISEQICACDATDCEVVLDYRNPVNVYGFPYEGPGLEGHRNRLRFCGDLSRAKMASNDYQAFKSSTGWYNTVYANLDEVEMLETESMPPYLAKNITVALAHADLLINGVPYVMKDFSQAEEQDNTELVSLNILVVKKDQTETYTYNV